MLGWQKPDRSKRWQPCVYCRRRWRRDCKQLVDTVDSLLRQAADMCTHRAGRQRTTTRRWGDKHRSQLSDYRWTCQAWLRHAEAVASEAKQELEAAPQTQWTPVRYTHTHTETHTHTHTHLYHRTASCSWPCDSRPVTLHFKKRCEV